MVRMFPPRRIDWLQGVLGERLTVFFEGGHLGNLYQTRVQNRIMAPLWELKTR